MTTKHSQGKCELESCKRLLQLANYRLAEDDIHEAVSVLNQAILSVKQAESDLTQDAEELRSIKITIYRQLAHLFKEMGRMELSSRYLKEGKTANNSAEQLDPPIDDSRAPCLAEPTILVPPS